MREDGEPRLGLADDALRVIDAEVRELRPAVQKDRVDQHHVGLVLLGDAVVVRGVCDPAQRVAKTKTVRLHLVHMAAAGRECHAIDRVGRFGSQADDLAGKPAQVLEDDRVLVERVGRTEQHAPVREPTVRHRLDHHVDVAGVVEVSMADHDRVEGGQVDLALRVLHYGTWPGVEADPRAAFFDEQPAGRGDLLRHHEPRACGAHESEPHLPTRWGGRPGS